MLSPRSGNFLFPPGRGVRSPWGETDRAFASHLTSQDLLNDADRVVNANDTMFGTPGGAVSVIVFALGGATDGTGGADHGGCDYQIGAAIEVCASFGNSARVSALFEAELSECSMGGNLCGASTGEALSRWCAATISNNALSDFATAPTWAGSGMPDFVNNTDPTDRNAVSTGCGMAFISWLISQGQTLGTIAPGMVGLGDPGQIVDARTSQWAGLELLDQVPSPGTTQEEMSVAFASIETRNAGRANSEIARPVPLFVVTPHKTDPSPYLDPA